MKTCHIISDLDSFGGAQNLVVTICSQNNRDNLIYTLFPLDGFLFKKAIKDGINVERLTFFIYIKLLIKGFNRKVRFHFHLSHAFYFSLLLPFGDKFYTEHSTTNKRREKKIITLIDKFIIYRTFNCITCISKSVQNSLIRYLNPVKVNTTVAYNSTNPIYQISKSAKDNLLESRLKTMKIKPIITMIARFADSKDQLTLIRALSNIPKAELYLIGPGNNSKVLKEIYDKKLLQRVHLPGQFESDRIKDLLKKTHVYVQSSNWEGFGLAPLEAMSMAVPTIVNSIDGLNEISPTPELIFSTGNFNELARKINLLINDYEQYKFYSKLCWENSKRFSREALISSILRSYKDYCLDN